MQIHDLPQSAAIARVAKETLSHSQISITMNRYTDVGFLGVEVKGCRHHG
jgi:hypothetical protein